MQYKIKNLTYMIIMAVFMAASGLIPQSMAETKTATIGMAAPNFTLTDSNGTTHSLNDFIGKTVVLEWTNHECPYVKKHYETNNMQNLQKEATDDGVIWLTINSSAPGMQGHTNGEAANMVIEKAGSHETARLLDPDGIVGKLYDARTTPHMYIINAEGTLVYAGAIDNNPSSRHDTVEGAQNFVRDALASIKATEEIKVAQTNPYGCSVKYKIY